MGKHYAKMLEKFYSERETVKRTCLGCKHLKLFPEDWNGECAQNCCKNEDLVGYKNYGHSSAFFQDKFKPLFKVRKCKAKKIRILSKKYMFFPIKHGRLGNDNR